NGGTFLPLLFPNLHPPHPRTRTFSRRSAVPCGPILWAPAREGEPGVPYRSILRTPAREGEQEVPDAAPPLEGARPQVEAVQRAEGLAVGDVQVLGVEQRVEAGVLAVEGDQG